MFSVVSLFLRVFRGLCLHADFSVGTPRGGAFSLTPHGGEAEHAGIKRFAPQHRKTCLMEGMLCIRNLCVDAMQTTM